MSGTHLLYVSPVIPALTGNGLAMRAGMVLQRLAAHHEISLLVVPLYPPHAGPVPQALAALCRDVVIQSPETARPAPVPRWRRHLTSRHRNWDPALADMALDIVHVFRLAAVPFARPYLQRSPRRHLDLDDIESLTHQRLASLYRLNGDAIRAQIEERLAQRYQVVEEDTLREFDRVYVCSDADRMRLRTRYPGEIVTLPNAVRLPSCIDPKRRDGRFRFLFAGTLGYYPNEDAARYFCREVHPILREVAPCDFETTIVGNSPSEEVRQLDALAGVRVIGSVPDMAPWYHDADAVVVPIRAGGGTRIKVLEAFSYRRPVVSTTLGTEGIEARHEEHLLIGDTPEAFAAHCRRLMTDPHMCRHLIGNAFSLLTRSYTINDPGDGAAMSDPANPAVSPHYSCPNGINSTGICS